LLTADPDVGADATELFNFLTVYSQRTDFKKLLVAPINLRKRMLELIERETEHALNGRSARIVAKLNRLADFEIVQALYKASQAGVSIDLIVRGVCTLRPGVGGLSENIRVRSIVGRLLEHSRVYYFANGGNDEVYIGSSDWMSRNLDRRVEVLSPVCDAGIRNYLKNTYLECYLKDNAKAWQLGPDGRFSRIAAASWEDRRDCQMAFQHDREILSIREGNTR
jgi:polyphosphate kinase